MKQILQITILITFSCIFYACGTNNEAAKESTYTIQKSYSKAQDFLQNPKNPTLEEVLIAIQQLSNNKEQSISYFELLIQCSKKNTFFLPIKLACILGTAFFSIENADTITQKNLSEHFLEILDHKDSLMRTTALWALAKNNSIDISFLSTEKKEAAIQEAQATELKLALLHRFSLHTNTTIFKKWIPFIEGLTETEQFSPYILSKSFTLLYLIDRNTFEIKMKKYCAPQVHAGLANRCWRFLSFLLSQGISKQELLPYTNKIGGNWLNLTSSNEWKNFVLQEPFYAKKLIQLIKIEESK